MRSVRVPDIRSHRPAQPEGVRARSRGGARLKAVVWLLILLAGGYVLYKVVPVYMANFQLQDRMASEARFATVNRKSEEDIREIIFREIKQRDIPARREDIHVQSTDRGVRISVDYSVTVDLRVYQLQLHFTPSADNRAL